MKCGYCGKTLKDGAKFCTYCGHNINDIRQEKEAKPPVSKAIYAISVLALLMLIGIICFGSVRLLLGNGSTHSLVSSSDAVFGVDAAQDTAPSSSPSEPSPHTAQAQATPFLPTDPAAASAPTAAPSAVDTAVTGNWICEDKTAAGYTASDYGIGVTLSLTLDANGSFSADYRLTDTGVTALRRNISGTFTTHDGSITFHPAKANDMDNEPTFAYSVEDGTLTLITENGKITFTRPD